MLPLIWLIAGLALVSAEFIIPEFVIFFFGLGALANSLLVALFPGIASSLPIQILTWLGLSALSLAGFRRYFSGWLKGKRLTAGEREAKYVGRAATVLEEIAPDSPGRIKFAGTSWGAVSYDQKFAAGEKVEILKQDGITFVVTDSILGIPGVKDDPD